MPTNSILKKIYLWGISFISLLVIIWVVFSTFLFLQAPKMVFLTERSKNLDFPNSQRSFERNQKGQNIEILMNKRAGSTNVILYLHGNSGRTPVIFNDLSKVATTVSPAYPGYSLSEGSPTNKNVYETAEIALKWITDQGYKQEQVIVFGHSMGGSPAVYLASKYKNIKKLVLVNTFSSVQSMCFKSYSIFCVFGGDLLNSYQNAQNVEAKVRQFHYENDDVVAFDEGKKLFEGFSKVTDKKFTILSDQTHNVFDIQTVLKD
jgi:esterase/lipase